jgi:hypothetical protein
MPQDHRTLHRQHGKEDGLHLGDEVRRGTPRRPVHLRTTLHARRIRKLGQRVTITARPRDPLLEGRKH